MAVCGGPARADDAALPTVTVTGARSELQDSGLVVRVPVEPLEVTSLAELLATVPGVQVRESGGLGSYSEASLRGSNGRQVRILLDGLPLDTGGGEATSLSLVSPLLLDEVDVYQGRVPVGLGSGLAGTINLRTRRTLAAPVVYAGALGSFGERRLDVAAQPASSVQLALGAQAADNDFPFRNAYKPYDPDDPERRDDERRRNDATAQYYGLLRYRGPLELTAHVVDDAQELPTRDNAPSQAELDTHSYALALALPERADWQAALSHRYTREDYRDPGSQIGLGAQDTRSDTQRTLLSLGRRATVWQDTLTAEHIEYSAEDALGAAPTASARRTSVGNGFAAEIGEARRYNAGLVTTWSRDEAGGGGGGERWQIEPALGASQRFESCLAAINLGRRQRLPTFFERYGDRGLFRGNPQLEPETANYGDLGARCRPGDAVQRLALTAFAQDLHDAINPTYNAQGVGRSVNTDRALIYGLELDSGGALAGVGWQLGGTWQHTEDRSEVRATQGRQLPGRFETQLSARLERPWRRLVFWYAFRYEDGAYYDSANLLKAPALQRHDLGVRGTVARLGWSLQALNLGDDRGEQFNGYPMPGRRWQLSLHYPDAGPAPSPSDPRQEERP